MARSPKLNLSCLEEVERRHILMILQKTGGLIEGPNGAARILDLNRSILRGRNEETGINRNSRQTPWAPPRTSAVPAKCDGPTRRSAATSWAPGYSSLQ